MKYLIIILFILSGFHLFADEYPIDAISPDLKKGSHAVIRLEEHVLEQKDLNNATERVTRVITILDEKGKNQADFIHYQDKFTELKSFSGEIILSSGKSFKKIGKGDLFTTAMSSNLASDDSWTYYNCSPPSYPFTVKYTYEVKLKNGVAWYPQFMPGSFDLSVEKSVCQLVFPAGISVRYKVNSLAEEPEKGMLNKDSIYTWKCENLQAITKEPLAPSINTLAPMSYIAPSGFCMEGFCGSMATWQETGKFISLLLDKRDVLPPATVSKVKELTAGAKSDKEKVKRIYEYLQETTRYVSIQLGIGGFQPIPAEQVAKTGFGDCKALSNYMKAMLNVAGISSDYAVVHTERKRMLPDFSSMSQGNHVILLVPLSNDSLWLECTSRDLPFNYVHSTIADHDVLLVKGEQSKLCRVRSVPDESNKIINKLSLALNPDASVNSTVNSVYYNHEMEDMLSFVINLSEKERVNALAEKLAVQHSKISQIQTEYIRTENPQMKVSYQMDAERYASATGARLFLSINPFRSQFRGLFSATERKLDIHLPSGIHQIDSIEISIPQGFSLESMPKPLTIESGFGRFSSTVEDKAGKLLVVQKIDVSAGKYPVTSYKEMKEFFQKADACLAGRLVVKKD